MPPANSTSASGARGRSAAHRRAPGPGGGPPAAPHPDRPLARRVILCLVLALAVSLAWRTETSRDFGYHLATGRWILEHHAWPRTDPFTYTVPDHAYIDMHGLYQIALALAFHGGMVGVGLLRVALVLATVAVMWITATRSGVRSPELLGILFALGLCAWELRFTSRPELATFLCLAIQLELLRRHAEQRRARWLYATVPLQLVWVYAHALSLLGIAVLGLYAAASLIEGLRSHRFDRAPWLALAAAAAVMFLNPYGLGGVRFLWDLRTRLESGNAFGESITELRSPFGPEAAGVWPLRAFKLLLVVSGVTVLARVRRMRLFELAVVLLFGALAATHIRNVGLFVVAVLPIALRAASELGHWLGPRLPLELHRARTMATTAVALAIVFLSEQAVAGGYYASNHRPMRFGYGESPAVFPIRTVAFLDAHRLEGPVFNTLDLGGYLIAHRKPGEKVFIDGRLEVIGEGFYREYSSVISGDGWDAMVRRYHPNLALVSLGAHALVPRVLKDPDWAVVETDGVAVLFARDIPAHHAIIEESAQRWRRTNVPAGKDEGLFLPPAKPVWLTSVLGPRRFPFEAWGRGNAFMALGMPEAARREYRRAIGEADRAEPALVRSYVGVSYRLGRLTEARAWCERLVELAPHDSQARELLASLKSAGRTEP